MSVTPCPGRGSVNRSVGSNNREIETDRSSVAVLTPPKTSPTWGRFCRTRLVSALRLFHPSTNVDSLPSLAPTTLRRRRDSKTLRPPETHDPRPVRGDYRPTHHRRIGSEGLPTRTGGLPSEHQSSVSSQHGPREVPLTHPGLLQYVRVPDVRKLTSRTSTYLRVDASTTGGSPPAVGVRGAWAEFVEHKDPTRTTFVRGSRPHQVTDHYRMSKGQEVPARVPLRRKLKPDTRFPGTAALRGNSHDRDRGEGMVHEGPDDVRSTGVSTPLHRSRGCDRG